jgi:hypothetical protein
MICNGYLLALLFLIKKVMGTMHGNRDRVQPNQIRLRFGPYIVPLLPSMNR